MPRRGRMGRLTNDQIKHILQAPKHTTNAELGRQYGVSPELIRQIHYGLRYTCACPEVPRRAKLSPESARRSCHKCRLWVGEECSFGFPDPLIEGPSFARDCDLYGLRDGES